MTEEPKKGLPPIPEGSMRFVCETHDGRMHVNLIQRPAEIPPVGGIFTGTNLPGYGAVVCEVIEVTDEMLRVKEVKEAAHMLDMGPAKVRDFHKMPAAGTSLYEVISWCSDDKAEKPEQVHLMFPVQVPIAHLAHLLKNVVATGDPETAYSEFMPVLRLKSRRACQELISAVTQHMNHVFPGAAEEETTDEPDAP